MNPIKLNSSVIIPLLPYGKSNKRVTVQDSIVTEQSQKIPKEENSLLSSNELNRQFEQKPPSSFNDVQTISHAIFLNGSQRESNQQPRENPLRTNTANNVEYLEQEENLRLQEKSLGWFTCVERKFDSFSGGYFYKFEIKDQFKNLGHDELNEEFTKLDELLFPASQLPPDDLRILIKSTAIFQELGYSIENDYTILPDEKIIMCRWRHLQKQDPQLPNLSIISSKGIADDRSFIKAIGEGHILLSSGCEFIHDHQIHVMKRILFVFYREKDRLNCNEVLNRFNSKIRKIAEIITEIEESDQKNSIEKEDQIRKHALSNLLWAHLGAVADTATYSRTAGDLHHFWLKDSTVMTSIIYREKKWLTYLEKRFGDTYKQLREELNATWEDIFLKLNNPDFENGIHLDENTKKEVIEQLVLENNDFDKAISLTLTILDREVKGPMIENICKALIKTGMLDKIIDAVQAIADQKEKDFALTHTCKGLSVNNKQHEAITYAQQIVDKRLKNTAFEYIFTAWAESNDLKANMNEISMLINEKQIDDRLIIIVKNNLSLNNIDKAINSSKKIFQDKQRISLFISILERSLALGDVENAIKAAHEIHDPERRDMQFNKIIWFLLKNDQPTKALETTTEIFNPIARTLALKMISKTFKEDSDTQRSFSFHPLASKRSRPQKHATH